MSDRGGLKVMAARAALLLPLLFAAACQTTGGGVTERTIPQAVEPQPVPSSLVQGLAVEYLRIVANHVDEVEAAGRGRPGKPLQGLKWNSTEQPVLTSAEVINIAARIRGLIRLEQPGTYRFRARSNDGVRVFVGDVRVVDDPGVHPTRLSDGTDLEITAPGWYPLYIVYFQKGGTASLELHWQPPGTSSWGIVPSSVLARVKD